MFWSFFCFFGSSGVFWPEDYFLIFMTSGPNFDIETPRHFENNANIAKQCDRMANQSRFAAFHWILSNDHGGFSLA
jgi:hypothetical protein